MSNPLSSASSPRIDDRRFNRDLDENVAVPSIARKGSYSVSGNSVSWMDRSTRGGPSRVSHSGPYRHSMTRHHDDYEDEEIVVDDQQPSMLRHSVIPSADDWDA